MQPSNIELFSRKKQLGIEVLSYEKCFFHYRKRVNLHGIVVQLNFDSKRNYDYLTSQLPIGYETESPQEIEISFYQKGDFNWGEESSSHCFLEFSHDCEFAIQRDFVGVQVAANSFRVILSDDIHNGFFNSLRWVLPRKMLVSGKVLLHCSALLDKQGRTNIFLGHSGAGKTTITKLASERVALGDDMNVLVKSEGCYCIQAGGLGGRTDTRKFGDQLFPIKAFHWIVQDSTTCMTTLSKSDAALKLVASCPNLFLNTKSQDNYSMLLGLAAQLTDHFPFYLLRFDLSTEFLKYVER